MSKAVLISIRPKWCEKIAVLRQTNEDLRDTVLRRDAYTQMDIWICARLRFPRLTEMLTAAA